MSFKHFLILSTLTIFAANVSAQEKKPFRQLDVFDILRSKKKRAEHSKDTLTLKPYKLYISAFPILGYNPALGIVVGATFNPAIFFGSPANTPISAFAVNAQVTTQSQILASIRATIFTNKAKFILRGDWRLYIYYQPTYGLGSDIVGIDTAQWINPSGESGTTESNVAEPMRFNYVRLYQTLNRRIIGKFYIGGGYYLDYYWNIKDTKLNFDSGKVYFTQHYRYSKDNGFNPSTYCTSGLLFSLLYDSRNSCLRPTRGIYALMVPRFNFTWLGSTRNSFTLYTEFRTYLSLSKRNPAHLIAFWYAGSFLLTGHVPYLDLPAIGWDTYGRTGRGYIQGRIRGVDYLYGEAEYRFPISQNTGVLGGVVFVNASTCNNADRSVKLFRYIAPGFGVGLRVMLNKKSLSNLTIDMGFGLNGSKGLFLNINETF
ncbi:MAG: BamA/TamA family outer membrane protein [bacterium]